VTCVGFDAADRNVITAPDVVAPLTIAVAGVVWTEFIDFTPGTVHVSPEVATVTVAQITRRFPKTNERDLTTVTAAIMGYLPS
jgi:hypothetical protein